MPRSLLSNPRVLLVLVAALSAFVIQSGELGTSDTTHRLQTTHSFWTSEPQVFPKRVSRVRNSRQGREALQLVWHGAVAADVSRRPCRHRAGASAHLRQLQRYRSHGALHLRQLHNKYSGKRADRAGVLSLSAATEVQSESCRCRSAGAVVLHHASALRAEHDGEQLHPAADHDRPVVPVRMAANRQPARAVDWIGGIRLEPADPPDDRAGPHRGRIVPAALSVVPARTRTRAMERFAHLRQDRRSDLRFLRAGRSSLSVLPLRIVHQYLRQRLRARAAATESITARELSLGSSISRRLLRSAVQAGEVHLSLRSAAAVDDRPGGAGVEAFSSRGARLRHRGTVLLFLYISFYARYTVWSGDFAWGDRYVSTAAEMVAFISVPLLLELRASIGKLVWISGIVLVIASTAIQLASLAFWLPLEIYQEDTLGHPTFVVLLRFEPRRFRRAPRCPTSPPRCSRAPTL